MKDKIKVLFFNRDGAGVNYFRTQGPAIELELNFSDRFHVELNPTINLDDEDIVDYLSGFDIINYHRQLQPNMQKMIKLASELKERGTTLIVDIDDYWDLHKNHPYYQIAKQQKLHEPILANLKLADYVTTTTDVFADEVRKVTGRDNVAVFYNSMNPEWMRQFRDNRKPDPDGRIRITYMAGSSHKADVQQLYGVINVLRTDPELKDKFKIIIAGWDTEGTTTDISFNQEFANYLQKNKLWTPDIVKGINNSQGNIDTIPNLPQNARDKFRDKVFNVKNRNINSNESIYLVYENLLTDNHKLISNEDYLDWLGNYERNVQYEEEGNFARRWTQKANVYAKVLDETDILLAPLDDNPFNRMKSNLKQVECWTRKIPIVCSDIPPYNVHGRHMENCILIPNKKNANKYWSKYLKRLILSEDLRNRLGNQLSEDFGTKYNLTNVTENRAKFYEKIMEEKLQAKKELEVKND